MGVYISDENGNLNKYAGSSSLVLPSISKILNMIYPIGSIYMSVNNVSPQVFLGGTWEKIQDTFLLAAGSTYSGGDVGGEETHTLTTAEMPSHTHVYSGVLTTTTDETKLTINEMPMHNHRVWSTNQWSNNAVGLMHETKAYGVAGVDQSSGTEKYTEVSSGTNDDNDTHSIISVEGGGKGHSHTLTLSSSSTEPTGGSISHNNMPPYLAVYMWKRVS